MRLESTTFVYAVQKQTWHVVFVFNVVNVWIDGDLLFSLDNAARLWKPCQSHAQDIIRMHRRQPART